MTLNLSKLVAAALLLGLAGNLSAQDPVSTVIEGCTTEIEQYCSQVSPGEGRMLACFYAHEEKLSSQCQYALYEAAAQLEAAINALNYVATECKDDIVTHCAEVELGEGRILECLNANTASVSAGCNQAIKDVTQ
jgi:hypothetical protein